MSLREREEAGVVIVEQSVEREVRREVKITEGRD